MSVTIPAHLVLVGQEVEVEDSKLDDPDPIRPTLTCVCIFPSFLLFEKGSCYVTQTGFKLEILLPLPPK
jgi:hypothetical protein